MFFVAFWDKKKFPRHLQLNQRALSGNWKTSPVQQLNFTFPNNFYALFSLSIIKLYGF